LNPAMSSPVPDSFISALAFVRGGALLAVAAACCLPGSSANADAYVGSAYEPFNYGTTVDAANPTTDASLTANDGGTGFNALGSPAVNTTAWGVGATAQTGNVTVVGGSLAGPLGGQGNRARFEHNAGTAATVGRPLGQTVNSGTLYFSYKTARNNDSFRTVNFALFNGTSERFGFGQYGVNPTSTSNGNLAGVFLNVNPGNLIQNPTPIAYGTNVPHLIVGRIDFDFDPDNSSNDRVRIYVDPANLSNEAALTPYLDNGNFDLEAITAFRPFSGGTNADHPVGGSGDFDEIRFGTTFASVVVPEPASLGLLAAAGGLLVRRRRAAAAP